MMQRVMNGVLCERLQLMLLIYGVALIDKSVIVQSVHIDRVHLSWLFFLVAGVQIDDRSGLHLILDWRSSSHRHRKDLKPQAIGLDQ